MKTKISSKTAGSIEELRDYKFDLTDAKQAYKYEDTLKKVGQCVGRIHGRDMRSLVISNFEKVFTKLTYPTGDTANKLIDNEGVAIGETGEIIKREITTGLSAAYF